MKSPASSLVERSHHATEPVELTYYCSPPLGGGGSYGHAMLIRPVDGGVLVGWVCSQPELSKHVQGLLARKTPSVGI